MELLLESCIYFTAGWLCSATLHIPPQVAKAVFCLRRGFEESFRECFNICRASACCCITWQQPASMLTVPLQQHRRGSKILFLGWRISSKILYLYTLFKSSSWAMLCSLVNLFFSHCTFSLSSTLVFLSSKLLLHIHCFRRHSGAVF